MKKILEIEEKPFLHGYYYAAAFMSIASCKARFDKSDAVISEVKWNNGEHYTADFKYDSVGQSNNSYELSNIVFPENIKNDKNIYDIFLGKYNDTFYESVFLYNNIKDYNCFSFKLETMKKVYKWSMAGIMIIDKKSNNFKSVFCPNNIIQISAKFGDKECYKEIVNDKNYNYLMTKVLNNNIYVYASTTGEISDFDEIYHFECEVDLSSYRMGFFLWIGEDYFQNWFYSNYIQLHCDKDLNINGDLKLNYYTTPMIDCRYNLTNPWLENYIIPRYYIDDSKEILDFIRKALNDDHYISLHLNEKYMKNKWAYNSVDFEHESLIYGIDDDQKWLYLMSFNMNQIFEPYVISYEDFFNAYQNVNDNVDIELLKYKIPNEPYKFSVDLLKTMLSEYLNGVNSSYRENLAKNIDDRVYGIKIYDVLLNNLDKLKDKKIIYLFYEHKLIMRKRLSFLNSVEIIPDDQYERIELDANSICSSVEKLLMYCLKYSLSNNKNLLIKIYDIIDIIRSDEICLLNTIDTILK